MSIILCLLVVGQISHGLVTLLMGFKCACMHVSLSPCGLESNCLDLSFGSNIFVSILQY